MRSFSLLATLALILAACSPPPTDGQTAGPEKAMNGHSPAPVAKPAKPSQARALKSPLPEGFSLPFAFHRLYDNAGKTKDGKPQRRVMVEFLDTDASSVQSGLTEALQGKGFPAPVVEQVGGLTQLTYLRNDGASVIAKIDGKRPKPIAANAKGTVHLTWNTG